MTKEFKLSEHEQVSGYFPKDKVKEFIRLIKEDFSNYKVNAQGVYKKPYIIYEAMIEIINKRSGDLK